MRRLVLAAALPVLTAGFGAEPRTLRRMTRRAKNTPLAAAAAAAEAAEASSEMVATSTGTLAAAEASLSESFIDLVPVMRPELVAALKARGISEPSPIQRAALPALYAGESALLAAATGSGKSLAFLVPTLERLGLADEASLGGGLVEDDEGCVLVVAPTRELALQLAGVAKEVLGATGGDGADRVELLVVGGATSASALARARCIVATAPEALVAFGSPKIGPKLQRVRSVILDEVDALLPPKKRDYRSAASKERAAAKGAKKRQSGKDPEPASDAEALLKLLLQSNSRPGLQVVGASATASRKTLDSLKSALRADPYGRFAATTTKKTPPLTILRVANEAIEDEEAAPRTVVVPREVRHRRTVLPRGATEAEAMARVAAAVRHLSPRSALVFLSAGSGLKVSTSVKALQAAGVGAMALHEAMSLDKSNRREREARDEGAAAPINPSQILTANHAAVAADFCLDDPLDVASGGGGGDGGKKKTPVLVTFEASARGLHFDAVDVVFVVGLPASASSYLHLAGRTGRRLRDIVQPGTVVTLAPPRAVAVLESWSKQLGDVQFEHLELPAH